MFFVALALTAYAAYAANESAEAQREANDIERQKAEGQAIQERRRMTRENRIRRAQVTSNAVAGGTSESSSYASALGGLQNQFGYNMAQSYSYQDLSNQQSEYLNKASVWQTRSQIASMLASYSGSYSGGSSGGSAS